MKHLHETVSDEMVTTVGIWVTADENTAHNRLQKSIYEKIATSHPEAVRAMEKFG